MNDFINHHPEWKAHIDLLAVPPTAEEVIEEFHDAAGCSLLNDDTALAWETAVNYVNWKANK